MKKTIAGAGILAAAGLAAVLSFGQVSKTVTIEISADISADVIEAYAWQYQYQETLKDDEGEDIPNPETKGQFALRMFTDQAQANIRSTYKSFKTQQGSNAAAIQADVDSLGITVQ